MKNDTRMKSKERDIDQKRSVETIPGTILTVFAGLLVTYHMWLSITRHFWAKENNMLLSPRFVKMLRVDFYAAIVFAACVLIWIVVSHFLMPEDRRGEKTILKRLCEPDCAMIIGLFIWYMITNLAYSDRSNQFVDYMRYELDAGICAVVMYPLARIIGRRRMKYLLNTVLHLILAFCTVTICVMMFNFFAQRELTLPNGLTVYGKKNGSVYFGVNQNLAAMIGVTMTYVCVFLFFSCKKRIGRIVYGVIMLPHILATLMTGSRACFLALLITVPMAAALFVWTSVDRLEARQRIICAALVFVLGAVCFWFLRSGVAGICRRVVVGASKSGSSFASKELFKDSGRLPIWGASLHMMVANAKQFVFGVPKLDIPQYIEQHQILLYGAGSSYAHAHNQILQVGCAQGVPAMIVFIAFWFIIGIRGLWVLFKGVKQRSRSELVVIPICLFGMMFVNMFEPFVWLFFSAMGCLFHLMGGMLAGAEDKLAP